MYDERNFCIFATSELNLIDFSQVLETSAETVRKSVDETLTFVKWDGETPPPSVQALTTIQGFYTYEEILDILNTPEWSAPMEVM
jgi:hypothetical protein